MLERLVMGEHGRSCTACPNRRTDRAPIVVGAVPVVGELCGQPRVPVPVSRAAGRQRFCDERMERAPLGRQEVFVRDLADERVAELVRRATVGLDRDEHMLVDGVAEVFDEVGLWTVGDGREQVMLRTPTDDGRDPQHALRLRGQGGQPGEQDLLERRREGSTTVPRGTREQFLDEERIAVRPGEHVVDEPGARHGSEDPGDLGLNLVTIEARQVDALDRRQPLEEGEQRQQRVPPGQLVRPVRPDQGQPFVAQPSREEGEQGARRRIGPVQVLEHKHDRSFVRQAAQHVKHGFEEALARIDVVVGWTERGRPAPHRGRAPAGRGGRRLRPLPR